MIAFFYASAWDRRQGEDGALEEVRVQAGVTYGAMAGSVSPAVAATVAAR